MNIKEFIEKIDNEGNLEYAFCEYGLSTDDLDESVSDDDKDELDNLIANFINARNNLQDKLVELEYMSEEESDFDGLDKDEFYEDNLEE